MRIAMFSSESLHSISSLGVHVTELAAGLQRRGHDVHVITHRMQEHKSCDCIDGVHCMLSPSRGAKCVLGITRLRLAAWPAHTTKCC